MRALIQRVISAQVTIDGKITGQIEDGLLVLICAMAGDEAAKSQKMAQKIAKLRIFKDDAGRMNKSLLDVGGAALIVSQFTLAADVSSGNRPGFSKAEKPEAGKILYQQFCVDVECLGVPVQAGEFGADMKVSLVNDGPVTIWMDA